MPARRDPDQEREALRRLRERLAAMPEAGLVGIVASRIGPEAKPWIQSTILNADPELLRACAAELLHEAQARDEAIETHAVTRRRALRQPFSEEC